MIQTITDEQKQLLKQTTLNSGMNAWTYILSCPEKDQYWAAAGILSCIKKGRPLNRLTIFWEVEDLRNPSKKEERPIFRHKTSKELEEKITANQKQLLQQTTLNSGTNAWDYVLTICEADQPWVALGILECLKKNYGLTLLEINWMARDLRYNHR